MLIVQWTTWCTCVQSQGMVCDVSAVDNMVYMCTVTRYIWCVMLVQWTTWCTCVQSQGMVCDVSAVDNMVYMCTVTRYGVC